MSVLLPGAPDLATYWRNVTGGVDAITTVPANRWDPELYQPDSVDLPYARRGGFVDEFAEVDVLRFGIMPASVAGTEPDQLIALRVAAEAIEDAGGEHRLPADRQRVGIVLGRGGYLTPGLVRLDQRVRTAHQLVRTLGELLPELTAPQRDRVRAAFTEALGTSAPESAIGLVPNLAASRVANRLDLRGPAYTIDAACASSLVAVDSAVRELAGRRCDVMLAGGVHHCHDVTLWSVFSQLGALSRSERIRPFHRAADGILIGEGTGVVVLKRLADAERDGDRVYAVIRGVGVASDGRAASLVSPDPGGQVRAVRQAWQAAGLDPAEPDSIGLLEAHGTATPAGDAAELATITEVFGPGRTAVIGSVKSMIGHTMPAAGIASLVKAALAVHHGVLPPTLHCDDPHPAMARTRFRPIEVAQPWEGPRRAGVNAFGFGGINAHVVLDQAPGGAAMPVVVHEPEQVLRLAAADPAALAALLAAPDEQVRELRAGNGPARLAIVGPTAKRLSVARQVVARGQALRGRNDIWFADRPLLRAGKLAFLFPGLEAVFEPNVADVARKFGLAWQAADVVVGDVGRHGAELVRLGRLLDAALRRLAIRPDAVAGHSIGEWTAMVCAGMYDEAAVDGFLASFRPDELELPGMAFAVLGMAADAARELLAGRLDIVLSHDNAPRQCMVCGPEDAIADVVTAARAQGLLAQVLPFRSGFHTPMLEPYLAPIRDAAEGFRLRPQAVPVWSATTASPYPVDPAGVRELFVRHLVEPVGFRPMVEAMYANGFRAFLVLGTGQLGSLVEDTLRGRDHVVVSATSAHRPGLAQLLRVATALWVDGLEPDLGPIQPRRAGVRLDLGSAQVSLDERTRKELGAALTDRTELSALDSHADRFPLAAELSALLRDTASSAATLLAQRPATTAQRLRVSLADLPYLADHCFFRQRADWPDPADRWPVVPATTLIGHMMAFAEQAAPGRTAVAVHDVRLDRWVSAIPAVDVPVSVTPAGPDRWTVALEGYARSIVELAATYPAAPPVPAHPVTERTPEITADQLYTDRWMFHGPRFQGVTELLAIGDRHVRGVLTTPPAPGALLDNVGQLFGYWIMATYPERTVVFPVRMGRIRFHGPHPAPGERLACHIDITSVTEDAVVADMVLIRDGRVWASFTGWQDRRFDSDASTRAASRFPERSTLSTTQPGGWLLVYERWPDLASRELIMRNNLGEPERAEYLKQPPRGRRSWLLGRIAVKDAARQLLWEDGEGDIFPAELTVGNHDTGQPFLTGRHGRTLPPLAVSLAHQHEVGVAIARPAGHRVGIDVTDVTDRPESTRTVALSPDERALLADCGDTEPWFSRFWAAKEAVAKAEGSGLDGAPRRFAVRSATETELVVRVADRDYQVHCADVRNPPTLPPRRYVVAWTVSDQREGQP